MGLEMTLHILHWLADGYGKDTRITNIVNSREVWIVFAVNPDGAEVDISGGRFHHWRKNRQPNAGTTAIGTDLNRNFGYHWGGGGRTSTNPRAITYRGPSAFSTPETRAMRDFLASRVVNGRQQIRTAITFHEYGRLVMWPYGYTHTHVPADMTSQDRAALVAIGTTDGGQQRLPREQASDLYVTSGTTRDYEYGTYRIFAYTFELSNVDYPKSPVIATETARNRDAVLYLAEQAGCPYAVLGVTVANARCGAFDDDMEVARGWTVNPDGTDTAPANARWARGDPAATSSGGVTLQPGTTASGRAALITGLAAGTSAGANDLDGADDRPLGADHARGRGGAAADLPIQLRARGERARRRTTCGRSSRRRTGRRPWSGSAPGRPPRSRAHGGRRRSRWTPGPARRSGSGSRRRTAAPTPRSRRAWTTCG